MAVLIKVCSLLDMLDTESAEGRGFIELVANNYEEDMADMYSVVVYGDIYNAAPALTEKDVSTATAIATIQMAYWGHGKLYNAEKVKAYTFSDVDGLWIVDDGDAEWACC